MKKASQGLKRAFFFPFKLIWKIIKGFIRILGEIVDAIFDILLGD